MQPCETPAAERVVRIVRLKFGDDAYAELGLGRLLAPTARAIGVTPERLRQVVYRSVSVQDKTLTAWEERVRR